MDENLIVWRYIWMTTTLFCAALALIIILCQENASAVLKSILFNIAALSSFGGLLHLQYFQDEFPFDIFPFILAGGIVAVGTFCYSIKFPERYFKSTFDILGSSHQIFHVSVVVGGIMLFNVSFNMYIARVT
jgi:predicted membrane channel-forming protein YqfA (hemolysin III family)